MSKVNFWYKNIPYKHDQPKGVSVSSLFIMLTIKSIVIIIIYCPIKKDHYLYKYVIVLTKNVD